MLWKAKTLEWSSLTSDVWSCYHWYYSSVCMTESHFYHLIETPFHPHPLSDKSVLQIENVFCKHFPLSVPVTPILKWLNEMHWSEWTVCSMWMFKVDLFLILYTNHCSTFFAPGYVTSLAAIQLFMDVDP